MQSNYDYSEFAPAQDEYDYSEFTPKKKITQPDMLDPKARLALLKQGAEAPYSEHLGAGIRAAKNIVQGLKQAHLAMLGKPGEAEAYTKEAEADRAAYNRTHGGQNPALQAYTRTAELAPLAALPIASMEGSMLKKMLTSGAGLGAYEATQFVPEGESRIGNIAKSVAFGVAFPPAAKVSEKIYDAGKTILRGKPGELINKVNPYYAGKRQTVKSQIADIEEKIPQASEQLAKIEPEVIESQQAYNESQQDLTRAKEAAEESPYVRKSTKTAIQRDLNDADIALKDLNQARLDTESKIGEATIPEPFEHDAKIAELEKSSQEKQTLADQHAEDMRIKDEEFKLAQEKAQENPSVRATTKGAIQGKINLGKENKAAYEKEQLSRQKEYQTQLEEEHKADQAASKATHEKLQAEADMTKAESQLKASENEVKATDHNISQFLDKRKEHDVDVARGVFEIADAERAAISEEFEAIKADAETKNIPLSNENAIRKKNDEILQLVQENKLHTKEMKKLLDELEVIKNTKTSIPASDYLRAYNTLRQESARARSKAFQVGVNDEERFAAQQRFNELDEKIEEMASVLEKGLGTEHAARLKKARDDWRDNVAVLYKNPVYQTIRWQGRINGDIMNTLRGTDKGNVKIRNIILNNPDIAKDTLGQRFANKPKDVMDIGVQEEQYINAVPEFKSMVEQRHTANNIAESSKLTHQYAKENHAESVAREKEAHTALKESKTLKAQTQKELDKLNKNLEQIAKEEPELIKHRDELIRIAKEKKTTLPKKLQAESEVKEINEHLKKLKEEKSVREKEIKSRQDEISIHTKNLEKIQSQISSIEEKLPHQRSALQEITEKSKQKQINYEQKIKLEKEKANLEKIVKTGDAEIKRLNKQLLIVNEKIDKSRTGLYKYVKGLAKQGPRLWRWSKRLFKGV